MKQTPFSFETVEDFDEHISLSIPAYKELCIHTLNISTHFVKDQSRVFDLGCSTGKLLREIAVKNSNVINTAFIGIDKAANLINDFQESSELGLVADLRNLEDLVLPSSCLITSIFTLQFLSKELRDNVLKTAYTSLEKGGAMIVAEKTFAETGDIQEIFTFSYYDYKRRNFSEEEILSKQEDLRYIMSLRSGSENEDSFRRAGFSKISTFWQSLNFKAWLLIK